MIAGKQYEFTAFRLDEYSLTINRIDLSEKLDWYGGGDEFPLIWKKNPITNVNSVLNKEIEDIHLLEYSMILDNENRNFFRQLTKHDFILVGIEFRLKELENCLHLSNGLDCNEMKIHTTKNDIINRRVQIK